MGKQVLQNPWGDQQSPNKLRKLAAYDRAVASGVDSEVLRWKLDEVGLEDMELPSGYGIGVGRNSGVTKQAEKMAEAHVVWYRRFEEYLQFTEITGDIPKQQSKVGGNWEKRLATWAVTLEIKKNPYNKALEWQRDCLLENAPWILRKDMGAGFEQWCVGEFKSEFEDYKQGAAARRRSEEIRKKHGLIRAEVGGYSCRNKVGDLLSGGGFDKEWLTTYQMLLELPFVGRLESEEKYKALGFIGTRFGRVIGYIGGSEEAEYEFFKVLDERLTRLQLRVMKLRGGVLKQPEFLYEALKDPDVLWGQIGLRASLMWTEAMKWCGNSDDWKAVQNRVKLELSGDRQSENEMNAALESDTVQLCSGAFSQVEVAFVLYGEAAGLTKGSSESAEKTFKEAEHVVIEAGMLGLRNSDIEGLRRHDVYTLGDLLAPMKAVRGEESYRSVLQMYNIRPEAAEKIVHWLTIGGSEPWRVLPNRLSSGGMTVTCGAHAFTNEQSKKIEKALDLWIGTEVA